jgi:hypothetical protein
MVREEYYNVKRCAAITIVTERACANYTMHQQLADTIQTYIGSWSEAPARGKKPVQTPRLIGNWASLVTQTLKFRAKYGLYLDKKLILCYNPLQLRK